ncbi:uncharacterized protein BXZ73DRAFT_106426 [Epithele typhae]|uniref:uncharacterized protein n=1 Tax=Epithele typhae TaxID=378194 RepID=UPI002008CCE6|nr:uncharacterized protein BXZ73DRAFT_106426 [Epithele typhae]KAH9914917.1 hypothetical protein BXZ73DRAFT_106426 [Epithele typhae]
MPAVAMFAPTIEQLMTDLKARGPESELNNVLIWIMEESILKNTPLTEIVRRVSMLTVVAMNTASQTITHPLFRPVANFALIAPLCARCMQ